MKTYCKGIDIEDPDTIAPFVLDCLERKGGKPAKWRRKDFAVLINTYTPYSQQDLIDAAAQQDLRPLLDVAHHLAEEVAKRIKHRDLDLSPIVFFERVDGISGKTREISNESAMQRIMDYVAIGALKPLLHAKIMPHQFASIKGRGQIAGKRTIERWLRRHKDSKYFAKLDAQKCFPSIQHEVVMNLLHRDIHKNPVLLWFIAALLSTYKKKNAQGEYEPCGLIIGTLLSQWMCNYVMSYFYRYIIERVKLRQKRRGGVERVRKVRHVLFYMDDIFLTGTRKADLKSAIREAIKWVKETFGLTIHNDWIIYKLPEHRVDMMGYVIGYKATTIRPRIFLRARRQYLRAWWDMLHNRYLSWRRAQLVVCYSGYFKYSDSEKIQKKYHYHAVLKRAKQSISYWARSLRYYENRNRVCPAIP